MKQYLQSRLLLVAMVISVTASEILSEGIMPLQVEKRSISEKHALPRLLTPNSYKLELQPFIHEGHFRGKVEINISCHEPTDTIALHADSGLQIHADSAIHSIGQWDASLGKSTFRQIGNSHHYERVQPKYSPHSVAIAQLRRNSDEDRYDILLKEKLKKGTLYIVKLEFLGNITTTQRRSGLYSKSYIDNETGDERWYVSTGMENGKARKVFPCFDEPSFKSVFQLSIALPSHLKAISTMPLKSTETSENHDDWKLDHFAPSPLMSTRSLGFIIFDPSQIKHLITERIYDVTVNGYGSPVMKEELESRISEMMSSFYILQKYLGISFPLPEINFVAIPAESYGWHDNDFWGNFMFGQSSLRSESFFFTPQYLLPKQWLGHMMTLDNDSKLLEGLGIHLAFGTLKEIADSEGEEGMVTWSTFIGAEIYKSIAYSNQRVKEFEYAWMWRMLNYTLTKETFRLGLYSFVHEKAFKSFTEDDLYEAMNNQAWLDDILPLTISVEDIAKSWTDQELFPIVTVTRHYEANSATVEQHPYLSDKRADHTQEREDHLFWIPVMYITGNNLNTSSMMSTFWMKDRQRIIKDLPDQNTFIIVNPQHAGMFWVNYDHKNWYLLSQYLLKSTADDRLAQIPAETRSKVLYDAMKLAIAGELDFSTALNMTLFLKHDRNINPWMIMCDAIEDITSILHDTYVYDKFMVYWQNLLIPAYQYFENVEFKGELKEMYMGYLTRTAAKVGFEPALTEDRRKFYSAITDNSLPVSLDVCGLYRSSDDDWELALKYVLTTVPTNESSSVNYFADLVWCNRKPEKLNRILYLLFVDDRYEFSDTDAQNIFYAIHDYNTLLTFILDHWKEIKSRYGDNAEIWNLLFEEATKDVKTEEGFSMVKQLYEKHHSELQSAKNIVETSLIKIEDHLLGKYRYVKEIEFWLNSQFSSLTSV